MPLFKTTQQSLPAKVLHEKYIVPPFSVFNTHQPYMKERMLMWRDMGFCGTNGRVTSNNGLTYDNRRMDKYAKNKKSYDKQFNGTSVFNPVVTEVVYKWFVIPGGKVFDPFAGGVTRGAIASALGLHYTGCDINPIQVASNNDEISRIQERYKLKGSCIWLNEDSSKFAQNTGYDLVFTCPPYYNLEKYTDIPEDLSNCESYETFLNSYTQVIQKCYNMLEVDSFMVLVVSDVRDKKTTEYYGLVADTVKIAQSCGFKFYNEIILYNETGNLAIVSGDYLDNARKVGRQHQNILVFFKGNPKNIGKKFGKVVE